MQGETDPGQQDFFPACLHLPVLPPPLHFAPISVLPLPTAYLELSEDVSTAVVSDGGEFKLKISVKLISLECKCVCARTHLGAGDFLQ